MLCLHRGFDGLDVSFAARIDHAFCEALEEAKEKARTTQQPACIIWRDVPLQVSESGARGGYAFTCKTGGELGAVWFFKRPKASDPWGVRASCRAFGLAIKGLGGMRSELHATLDALGIVGSGEGESIGRVDYAVDILLPELVLEPKHFVMHSNSNREDNSEPLTVNGCSNRVTSVTVGKMPGRQVIVYDKRAEVIARGKAAWWTIWNNTLERKGLAPLDAGDPSTSRVWRVEIRAGKKYLKDRWALRRWVQLDEHFGDVAAAILSAIRYADPTADSNRSRWPESSLWHLVREQLQGDLGEMKSSVAPDLIKRVQLEAHDKLLAAQMFGLLVLRGALNDQQVESLPAYARKLAALAAMHVSDDLPHYAEKLSRAKERYWVERS